MKEKWAEGLRRLTRTAVGGETAGCAAEEERGRLSARGADFTPLARKKIPLALDCQMDCVVGDIDMQTGHSFYTWPPNREMDYQFGLLSLESALRAHCE